MDRQVLLQDGVGKLPDRLEGHQVKLQTLVAAAGQARLATFRQRCFQLRRSTATYRKTIPIQFPPYSGLQTLFTRSACTTWKTIQLSQLQNL